MRFRKKPVVVDGRIATETEVVLTAHGRVRAEPGDWILRNPETGDTWPIKPDIFADTYERVHAPEEHGFGVPGLAPCAQCVAQ